MIIAKKGKGGRGKGKNEGRKRKTGWRDWPANLKRLKITGNGSYELSRKDKICANFILKASLKQLKARV